MDEEHGRRAFELIARHFEAENGHDIPGTLDTYTDDVIWDDVANPACPVQGKDAALTMYQGVMAAIPDLALRSVERFACDRYVVDESVLSGHVMGTFLGVAGGGAAVSFRILHVFEIRDNLICSEQAWLDSAAALRQIATHTGSTPATTSPSTNSGSDRPETRNR